MEEVETKVAYDDPATDNEVHSIAVLCLALGIESPMEEKKMTHGEAGRLIRRLGHQLDVKKGRLGNGRKRKEER